MLIFGAQKSPPALPTFIITRASVPIAAPIAEKRGASKVEATPMISGKEVAVGVGGRKLTDGDSHTPCSASPHHCRGTEEVPFGEGA